MGVRADRLGAFRLLFPGLSCDPPPLPLPRGWGGLGGGTSFELSQSASCTQDVFLRSGRFPVGKAQAARLCRRSDCSVSR